MWSPCHEVHCKAYEGNLAKQVGPDIASLCMNPEDRLEALQEADMRLLGGIQEAVFTWEEGADALSSNSHCLAATVAGWQKQQLYILGTCATCSWQIFLPGLLHCTWQALGPAILGPSKGCRTTGAPPPPFPTPH